MKIRSWLMGLAWGIAAASNSNANPNLLADPGFESGTPVPGEFGGWATVVDAAFSQTYHRSGAWSMKNYYAPTAVHGVTVQGTSATPGADYLLTGWAFTPQTLSSSSSLGFVILFFTDVNGFLIGQFLASAPLDNTAPANTWIQLSVDGIAPANATSVYAETTLWNPGLGDVIYFDDLNVSVVPEPLALAVLGAGLGVGLMGRRRTRPVGS